MNKKISFLMVVLIVLTLVISACQSEAGEGEDGGEGDAIKIGFLAPTSSGAAESAQDMIDAWNMFWDEHGREVAGREIQVFIEDDAGDPDVALSKARLLVEQREVDMLVGLLFAHTGYAVAEYVEETGTPTFFPVIAADDLTQREPVDNVIRIAGWTGSQIHHPFGEWVAKNTDCQQVYTLASDYAFGHEVTGGFINTFTDNGGQVMGQLWNPTGETDFSSYLATIQSAEPDCVFSLQVGASAVRLLKAYSDFGLKDQIPLYAGEVLNDQSILRGVEPPEIGVDYISAGHYAEGRQSPDTQRFVEAYDEKFDKLPSYYAVSCYTAGRWIARALEDVDGNVEDQEAFLEAIRQVEFADTPMGPMSLDEYDNTIMNIYIRRVEMREDGRIWNTVIDTYPGVSQFYKYDPEEYMAQPLYSRDYQGVDWP